jgi:hypothetical protein
MSATLAVLAFTFCVAAPVAGDAAAMGDAATAAADAAAAGEAAATGEALELDWAAAAGDEAGALADCVGAAAVLPDGADELLQAVSASAPTTTAAYSTSARPRRPKLGRIWCMVCVYLQEHASREHPAAPSGKGLSA